MGQRILISHYIHVLGGTLRTASEDSSDRRELLQKYGLLVGDNASPDQVSAVRQSLNELPHKLAVDCGIHSLDFEDMGPSMDFYPNHGKYIGGTLVLNKRIIDDPKTEKDNEGNELSKFDLILYHEMGHGFDEAKAKRDMLCIEPEWLELSGWSKEPKDGLNQMIIRQPGKPTLKDPWFYDPKAGFPRYYGKRNPWDDWADAFSFYVGGLKSRLPKNKRAYFDKLLGSYYG